MALVTAWIDGSSGVNDPAQGFGPGADAYATYRYALSELMPGDPADTLLILCAGGADTDGSLVHTWPASEYAQVTVVGDIPQDGTYNGFDSSLYYNQNVNFLNQGVTFSDFYFQRLQFRVNEASSISYCIGMTSGPSTVFDIDQCYFGSVGASTNQPYGLRLRDDDVTGNVRRSIFEGNTQANSGGLFMQSDGMQDVQCNTFLYWNQAIIVSLGGASSALMENNVAVENNTDFANNSNITYANNLSQDGVALDLTHTTTVQTIGTLMTDAGGGDFTIPSDSSDLYDNGKDLSAVFTVDITGNTYVTDDVGAFAFVSVGGGGGRVNSSLAAGGGLAGEGGLAGRSGGLAA